MNSKKILLCICLSAALQTGHLHGQLEPEGDEFVVNSYTTGRQLRPWVASGPGGDFVVVWDDFYSRVSGQRFAADGSRLGDEFQVNTNTTGYQGISTVDIGPGGEFIVIWQGGTSFSDGQDGDKAGIMGQQYGANGSPIGDEFQVNTYTTESQRLPQVAIGPTSEFVVVWDSKHDGLAYNIQGQLFAANGTPVGAEFPVNSPTHGTGAIPALDFQPDGNFIVVWQGSGSVGNDDDGASIQGQRFDADANKVGPQFQANDYTTGNQFSPRIAVGSDGNFVVVWNSFGSPGDDFSQDSVQARRFAANAIPLGDQFQVNTYTTQIQRKASVTIDPSGGFTVSWTSGFPNPGIDGPDGSLFGIAARPYLPDGTPASGEFVVNSFTLYNQYRNALASGPDGQIVVVWESVDSGPAPDFGPSVLGQRFSNSAFVFTDGFESGDISSWSSSVP
jgi:hypothetical protein